MTKWHAENCGAVAGAEQMRRERDEARGDLAAQERITAELRPAAQVVHTVRTRGGVGDVAGVRIERVQDGTTATERRLEEVRGAVERVRGLHQHGPDHLCTACAEAWPCSTIAALDGGKEAGRG